MPARKATRDYPAGIALAIIHVGALGVFIPALFSWWALGTAIVLYIITGMGITLGYHRLLTHRSLVLPRPLEYAVAMCGVLALQGGPIDWVATHRAHHANSDADGDPHDANKGMPWSHIEWLFRTNKDRVPPEDRPRWAPDLTKDPVYRAFDFYHLYFSLALGVVLFLIGGWSFVVWALFARLVFTYHCTWLVNSASHAIGYQTYRTGDRSTNNWLVALLSFGEGWHNNHHAFPFSARHGMRWYEIDVTYYAIKALRFLRLARNVKIPTREMLARMQANNPATRAS